MVRNFIFALIIVANTPAQAFDSFEHSEIGREAFKAALTKIGHVRKGLSRKLFSQKHLNTGPEPIGAVSNGKEFAKFTFGDLVAIFGDYALTVEEVNSSPFVARTGRLKKVVRGEGSNVQERDLSIALALNNPTHFSARAAQTYVRWHRVAMIMARQKNRLREALHYEALALHSFTDLFAFGHMHEDRELTDKLIAWGKNNTHRAGFTNQLATNAGKLMGGYVNFYHNAYNWKGAMLKNLAGDSWRGYGDKKYRVVSSDCSQTTKIGRMKCSDPATRRQRQIIVHAASVSILDVLKAAAGKNIRVGTEFRAMCHLPVIFWNSNKPIPPEKQKASITRLNNAMRKQGRPMEKNGFDYELGYLKFENQEFRGSVNYIDYVKQHCGKV